MPVPCVELSLGIPGFSFADLYSPFRLRDLHQVFWDDVRQRDPEMADRFDAHKLGQLGPSEESQTLIDLAAHVGRFIERLFGIERDADQLRHDTLARSPVFRFKKEFLRTRLAKNDPPPISDEEFATLDQEVRKLLAGGPQRSDGELHFAETVLALLDFERASREGAPSAAAEAAARQICNDRAEADLPGRVNVALGVFAQWCRQVLADPGRRERIKGWVSFVRPNKLDFDNLVHLDRPRSDLPEAGAGEPAHLRLRDGFKLTDNRMNPRDYLREIDYCIICHPRQKDSCSRGFKTASGGYQLNPLGIPLSGCPLDERISEMHELRARGDCIAALAMIMLDNPMCPGTGHRICNDCMKGCIFQKQDPVNIPQTETGILTDVLGLPYGFEIYSLLTRFNPLDRRRPYPLPYHGENVLVVGLGPAGYTLAHFLANEGFGVVGIDALKLEPMAEDLVGAGGRPPRPVRDFKELAAELDERILLGFGGVSEYGITVRWDKTFLAVIYLTLLRRATIRFYGGIRFGGTLEFDDAWRLGFKHVALATGAGKPTVIGMKNNLIRGIRTASDFLMALQLTGAFKRSSLASLQVRLPAIVIGGGLTAIDTATELLAYYPVQVEKTLEQYEGLVAEHGEDVLAKMCDPEEREVLRTFLDHGRAVRAEREQARREGRVPDLIGLCQAWGGVSIVYRKRLADSPAYKNNHEEVAKALEEGIGFIENLSPVEAVADEYGAVAAIRFKSADGREVALPAKSVCVAAGTTPNTVYEREHAGTLRLDREGRFFLKHRLVPAEQGWRLEEVHGEAADAFFLSHEKDGRFVSFYGDNHPDYAGNVVKAMASAKRGAPAIFRLFEDAIARAESSPTPLAHFETLTEQLDYRLIARDQ